MAEFIVAIELGSSKMTGIAGKKNLDGSITVLAVVKEDSSSFIRKGVIYNIDKTAQSISSIVQKLSTKLKTNIAHVYVGVGGQSIISIKNNIVKELPPDTIVTQQMVDELMDANRNMSYQDQEILYAATQEYKVDNQYQIDPVGIQCQRLEGNFLNILWRNEFYRKLNKCFDIAGVAIAEMYLAPLALADSVLTDAEKRSGCALIDLGADTTTISVYYKNVLRHLAVIPLGSANITKDIASLQIEENVAEQMKLKYASAWTDNADIDNNLTLPIDSDRHIESRKFIEIVEARLEEIIENAWYQVPGDYADRLLGGIILTGGGSNLKNIETAFRKHTHIEKLRIAKFVTQTITSKENLINSHNGMFNTLLGILAKGDLNCAGTEVDIDLFGPQSKPATTSDLHTTPRKPNELSGGVVQTAAEKDAAEEERRRKEQEAAEEAARQAEIEEQERRQREEEERRNRKKNSWANKIKETLKGLLSEPEDE